jgi:hypothetical protein
VSSGFAFYFLHRRALWLPGFGRIPLLHGLAVTSFLGLGGFCGSVVPNSHILVDSNSDIFACKGGDSRESGGRTLGDLYRFYPHGTWQLVGSSWSEKMTRLNNRLLTCVIDRCS